MTILTPEECKSKDEIRYQIDLIDKEILELFALRFSYVKEIVKYKHDSKSIVAQDRKTEVIKDRANYADKLGLDSRTFEQIYTLLIDSNIQKEMDLLRSKS